MVKRGRGIREIVPRPSTKRTFRVDQIERERERKDVRRIAIRVDMTGTGKDVLGSRTNSWIMGKGEKKQFRIANHSLDGLRRKGGLDSVYSEGGKGSM